MFELITQIIILVALFFLLRFVFNSVIGKDNRAWLGGFVLILLVLLAFFDPNDKTISSLWSVLSFPLRPLGLALLLLGYSVRQGAKKIDGTQALAAFMILFFFSLPLTAYLFTQSDRQLSAAPAVDRPVSAIVVLGDGTLPSDPVYRIRTQVSSAEDSTSAAQRSRIIYAAEQWQAQNSTYGNQPLIIVNIPSADQNQARGVDALLGNRYNYRTITADDPRRSAEAVAKVLSEAGIGGRPSVMVISPSINSRRIGSSFAKMNFDVVPRPTDFYGFQIQRGLRLSAVTDLIPSAEALSITTRVIDEYLATIYYFLRGWLSSPLGL
jgi:uncharacterized SAM-binding protein YcdF (DUF218 family)